MADSWWVDKLLSPLHSTRFYPHSRFFPFDFRFVKIFIVAVKDVLWVLFQAGNQICINDFNIIWIPDIHHADDSFFLNYFQPFYQVCIPCHPLIPKTPYRTTSLPLTNHTKSPKKVLSPFLPFSLPPFLSPPTSCLSLLLIPLANYRCTCPLLYLSLVSPLVC